MRVLFCGSGAFAVPTVQAVLASAHEIVGVATQPARPAGRGGHGKTLRPTPVAQFAGEAGLNVVELADINAPESVAALAALSPDVTCVADFGQFIRAAARGVAQLGAFNLHGSLLPELRGAAPIHWAIIRGHARTGATTFSLVNRMDAGPVYLQAETDIRPDETAEELEHRIAALGAELVCRTLDGLAAGTLAGRAQDESLATLAPKLGKDDGVLDFAAPAETVRNLIHGVWPWPGGQTVFCSRDGRRVELAVARAKVAAGGSPRQPGELDGDLLVATGAGRLEIVELRPAGKRLMGWRDFVNGYRVREGDRFIRPDRTEHGTEPS